MSTLIYNYLLIAPHLLLVLVALGMWRRGLYKSYLLFFAYVVYNAIAFIALFPVIRSPLFYTPLYFKLYCVDLGISTALRFAIVAEVAKNLFGGQADAARFAKPVLRVATILSLLITVVVTKYAGSHDPDFRFAALFSLDRAVSVVQCVLFLLLLCFSSYLHLSWRSRTFGIALGFGMLASTQLIGAAFESQMGARVDRVVDYFLMGAYHCGVLIWSYYLFVPERKQQLAMSALPKHDIDSWNRELQQLLQK